MPSNALEPPEIESAPTEEIDAELDRRDAAESFRIFFDAFPPALRYIYGRHTVALIERLQRAAEDYAAGRSTHLIINIPFRHGKSDVLSRRFGPWLLLRDPETEIMIAAYGQEKANEFSIDARRAFLEIAPAFGLSLDPAMNKVSAWRLTGHKGVYQAVGLGGGATGKGAGFLGIDDPHKNFQEAESPTMRDTVWNGFKSDLMTRLAPIRIVCICANRWGIDDLCGRVIESNTPGTDRYDPDFPKFEVIKFPVQSEEYKSPGNPDGWLFPERIGADWYRSQRATLGPYAWSAMGLQDPAPRTGNMLRADLVKIEAEMPDDIRYVRAWDLASTEKELVKDDPDYTAGVKGGVKWITEERDGESVHVPHIYIPDARKFRLEAVERDKRITQTAKDDGPGVRQRVETVAGYKDAGSYLKRLLNGISTVDTITPHKDKVVRAGILEPIFGAGNVHILRAPWNDAFLAEIALFPGGVHDDYVDALVGAVDDQLTERMGAAVLPSLAGQDTLNQLIMGMEPVLIAPSGEDQPSWRIRSTTLSVEEPRRGRLFRAIKFSLAGQSAVAWAHRGEDESVIAFRAWESPGRISARDFAKVIAEKSRDAGALHSYAVNLIVGDNDKPGWGEFTMCDTLRNELRLEHGRSKDKASLLPVDVDPLRLEGAAGWSEIEALIEGTLAERMRQIYVSPGARLLVDRLAEARMKPETRSGETPTEAQDGGGALVTCLRMLAGVWAAQ